MRPICFLALLIFSFPAHLASQGLVASALRKPIWPCDVKISDGISWSVFSKQYYGVSNWNASGITVGFNSGKGQSAVLLYRDGIPGFSWYHLYLSHSRQFKKLSGVLQLRFSAIDLKDRPLVFRLGGNINTTWLMSQTLSLQVSIFDFPGWLFPATAIARGDPAMRFLLFHEPGRLLNLTTGFQISRSQFGPIMAGLRMNLSDQLSLNGLFDVLPFGVSFGMGYRIKGYSMRAWVENRNGMGMTPTVEVGRVK